MGLLDDIATSTIGRLIASGNPELAGALYLLQQERLRQQMNQEAAAYLRSSSRVLAADADQLAAALRGLGPRIAVHGLRELVRDLGGARSELGRELGKVLRELGDEVRIDSARRLARYSEKSAAGLRVRGATRAVFVQQTLRKTTGRHADFGGLQMRKALLPALDAHETEIARQVQQTVDRLTHKLEGDS